MNRARLNACEYEKFYGVHYDSTNATSPVTNNISIDIVLVMKIMAAWTTNILDVKRELLYGSFNENG